MVDLNTIVSLLASNKYTPPELSIEKKGAKVSVSFPRNHPLAEKFLALAKELATIKTSPGGIEYNTGPNQKSVERVLTLLKDIVDVPFLEEELKRQQGFNTMKAFGETARDLTKDPYTANKAILGTGVATMLGMSSAEQQLMANIIEEDAPKQN